jgi:hypothetical protein
MCVLRLVSGSFTHWTSAFICPGILSGVAMSWKYSRWSGMSLRYLGGALPSISSGASCAKRPVLCEGDGPFHKLRKWYQQFYV